MAAEDFGADPDVRVTGSHRIDAEATPFLLIAAASEGRPRGDHIAHWDEGSSATKSISLGPSAVAMLAHKVTNSDHIFML